jgi:hypothetical protein
MWRTCIENEDVTWSSFLEATVSVVKQWTHWMWKTLLYWILLSSEFLRFTLDFCVNWFSHLRWSDLCMIAFETRRHRENDDLSFTTVNVFFHARNLAFFMRNMLVFALLSVKSITSIDSESKSSSLWDSFWNSSKTIVFHEWKMRRQWLMNVKVSRKQDEDETLSNSRLKRLLLFLVLDQASSAIHFFCYSFIYFLFSNNLQKTFWSFSACRLCENLFSL